MLETEFAKLCGTVIIAFSSRCGLTMRFWSRILVEAMIRFHQYIYSSTGAIRSCTYVKTTMLHIPDARENQSINKMYQIRICWCTAAAARSRSPYMFCWPIFVRLQRHPCCRGNLRHGSQSTTWHQSGWNGLRRRPGHVRLYILLVLPIYCLRDRILFWYNLDHRLLVWSSLVCTMECSQVTITVIFLKVRITVPVCLHT
jgi:hypothetical protein